MQSIATTQGRSELWVSVRDNAEPAAAGVRAREALLADAVKAGRTERASRELHYAGQLAKGFADGFVDSATGFIEFCATPGGVTESIMSTAKQLDVAATYYQDHLLNGTMSRVADDAACAGKAVVASIQDYMREPSEQQGKVLGNIGFQLVLADVCGAASGKVLSLAKPELITSRIPTIERIAAGAGGDWKVLNERVAADVVTQSEPDSCAPACGEMLSRGEISQSELIDKLMSSRMPGADIMRLGNCLGADWKAKRVTSDSLNALIAKAPFAAELRDAATGKGYRRADLSHVVVVDGTDADGRLKIRDPKHGTKYEMMRDEFLSAWTGGAVWKR